METLRHVRIWTTLIALSISFTFSASAQNIAIITGTTNPTPVTPAENIGTRLARLLTSDVREVRKQALDEVVFYSHFNNGEIDFTTSVPVLLAIYSGDPEEPHRLAALSALHAIGNEPVMYLLKGFIKDQSSPRVQVATLGALVDYFGISFFDVDREMAALAEALMIRSTRQDQMKTEPKVAVRP